MELKKLLDKCINDKMIDLTISGQRKKSDTEPFKVKIRPVVIKNELMFQASLFVGRKVLHNNYNSVEVRGIIEEYLLKDFKQAQFMMTDASASVLISKSGTITCKYKPAKEIKAKKDLSHNRVKKYIIEEGMKVPFLIDLGIMTNEGHIVKSKYDKFRQINRFLDFIEDILPRLDKDREKLLSILDVENPILHLQCIIISK